MRKKSDNIETQKSIDGITSKKASIRNLLSIVLGVVGLFLVGLFCMINFVWTKPPIKIPQPSDTSSLVSQSSSDNSTKSSSEVPYPTDKLFITEGRKVYKDGEITLRVPRLNLKTPVLSGTTPKILDMGVGLYDYSQLPGKSNRNVSMTAHRNVEFQNIETITDGDMIYLEYGGIEYTYEYEGFVIVKNDDWTILHCKDYPVVTLVSCHPVNSSQNRIVVTGRFVSQKELPEVVSSEVSSEPPIKSEIPSNSMSVTSSAPTSSEAVSAQSIITIESEPVPQSSVPADAKAVVLIPTAAETATTSNAGGTIDYSNSSEGYIMVKYEGSVQKLKLQLTGPNSVVYTYSIHPNVGYETFPLTAGDGSYKVNIYENLEGTKYAYLHGISIDVAITDQLKPYLYPNQYVNFTTTSKAVAKGEKLAAGAANELEIVQNIYSFVVSNIKYDDDKANNAQSGKLTGYLPVVDDTLSSGKGICFDYAALLATMLRSQKIPTRLEIGYASGNIYHAWVSVHITGKGWINGIIQFDGTTWKLMDPTFASSSNSSKSIMKFIGDGSNYKTAFLY